MIMYDVNVTEEDGTFVDQTEAFSAEEVASFVEDLLTVEDPPGACYVITVDAEEAS